MYIIFICLEDPFCKDLPIYTFTSRCKEDSSVAFENGTIDIVRNAAGDPSMTNTGIASLLQYVESDKANGSDSLTAQLSQAVRDAHEDEEGANNMNMLDWDIRDARAAAAKEGRAEGCAEGTGNEQDRGSSLIAAMERDGLGPRRSSKS